MNSCSLLYTFFFHKLKILTVENFADFRALIEKFPSWKEKVTSRAELKIVQLEPWIEPTRLGLITSNYPATNPCTLSLVYFCQH